MAKAGAKTGASRMARAVDEAPADPSGGQRSSSSAAASAPDVVNWAIGPESAPMNQMRGVDDGPEEVVLYTP